MVFRKGSKERKEGGREEEKEERKRMREERGRKEVKEEWGRKQGRKEGKERRREEGRKGDDIFFLQLSPLLSHSKNFKALLHQGRVRALCVPKSKTLKMFVGYSVKLDTCMHCLFKTGQTCLSPQTCIISNIHFLALSLPYRVGASYFGYLASVSLPLSPSYAA